MTSYGRSVQSLTENTLALLFAIIGSFSEESDEKLSALSTDFSLGSRKLKSRSFLLWLVLANGVNADLKWSFTDKVHSP